MRTVFLFIIYSILVILLIPLLLICMVFRSSSPLFVVARWAMRLGRWILGVRVQLSGLERQHGEKTLIFMPNHESFLDGPLLFLLIPQKVRVIMKREIGRMPGLGQAMKFAEFVSVDRKGKEGGKKSVQKAVRLIREKKYSFLIFPEGTRSRDGKMHEFRRGGFFLALDSRSDIVPVSISGTYGLMPKGHFFIKRGTINVVFHPPVSLQNRTLDDMSSLMSEVKQIILSGIVKQGSANVEGGV